MGRPKIEFRKKYLETLIQFNIAGGMTESECAADLRVGKTTYKAFKREYLAQLKRLIGRKLENERLIGRFESDRLADPKRRFNMNCCLGKPSQPPARGWK